MSLILIWGVIIALSIIFYVLLDGFDLGIGILFPWMKGQGERDIMMSTVAPVWDGNETWLIMGGASLYSAFPVAYSTILPTLYMPIMIMLAALIFRGIAFEFRFKADRTRFLWDISFAFGSILAAFAQGLILGTFVKGYGEQWPIAVSSYHWLSPFSVITGIGLVCAYALLGSNWLIIKTTGSLQSKMYRASQILSILAGIFLAIISVWTPLMEPYVAQRWISLMPYLIVIGGVAGFVWLYHFYALRKRFETLPFLLSVSIFILGFIVLAISDWPYIIPHTVTIWEAASQPSALKFVLVGVSFLFPILLIYTAYAYYVFRGKVTDIHHY